LFCSLMTEPEKFENHKHELDTLDSYFLLFGIAARLKKEKEQNIA